MSASLPVLSCRDVSKRLRRSEFDVDRQAGAHKQFRHPDGRATTVSDHGGRDIDPRMLKTIAADIGAPVRELIDS